MRKRLHILALILLILSSNAFGGGNKTKTVKTAQKTNLKEKVTDRIKRFADYDENDGQFWANRGKRQVTHKDFIKDDIDQEVNRKYSNSKNKLYDEPPFWGNRGRRSSEENDSDPTSSNLVSDNNDYYSFTPEEKLNGYPSLKDRRENTLPFWGNRGRRNSVEISVDNDGPFWSSRGRRQEEEPFWGTRGRRENGLPFWGNRGRRDNEPFWGNRGRREDNEPFWGNRGRREENEPFWGNRGRRQDDEPFWGNRGKKEDEEPFWGNRGKKELDTKEPFWGNRGRRKEDFKESIMEAINKVENDIDYLSRLKKDATEFNGRFWKNRGRDSQLKHLFDNPMKNQHGIERVPFELTVKPSVSSTLLDDRIYADQPHYILVERSSRSSGESLDPYYISRGKKYFKPSRGRRNAIEEIVKSVRNDPYYIARGKKDFQEMNLTHSKSHDGFSKAKELICATIELSLMHNESKDVKREINEDRDRRNILKKLAAQLQNDPYFVSRGKKTESKENDVEEFISQVAAMCN
ncbi:uncharacterized protein PF3D7_1120000 [Leguminivora glycinivorella]|uniref:uncharacterized protein PF3D7_1120000 n=1 Tax=Leguminivora glycinivorella TaxID=1035111 RepID=UPI00200C2A36|nr:uncharacterized protein PF3D7_1120000 [Leguminivora glycinivorella]